MAHPAILRLREQGDGKSCCSAGFALLILDHSCVPLLGAPHLWLLLGDHRKGPGARSIAEGFEAHHCVSSNDLQLRTGCCDLGARG